MHLQMLYSALKNGGVCRFKMTNASMNASGIEKWWFSIEKWWFSVDCYRKMVIFCWFSIEKWWFSVDFLLKNDDDVMKTHQDGSKMVEERQGRAAQLRSAAQRDWLHPRPSARASTDQVCTEAVSTCNQRERSIKRRQVYTKQTASNTYIRLIARKQHCLWPLGRFLFWRVWWRVWWHVWWRVWWQRRNFRRPRGRGHVTREHPVILYVSSPSVKHRPKIDLKWVSLLYGRTGNVWYGRHIRLNALLVLAVRSQARPRRIQEQQCGGQISRDCLQRQGRRRRSEGTFYTSC